MTFLEKYDPSNDYKFNAVKFRPGAKRTTPFGIDITTPEYTPLRLHAAIDSGYSRSTHYDIYAPFDILRVEYISEYGSFGSVLRLFTDYGFEIRLMHMHAYDIVCSLIEPIKARTLIGHCGNKGLGTARHLHMEIVSDNSTCEILDDILLNKYDSTFGKTYTQEMILTYGKTAGLTEEESISKFNFEKNKRFIDIINNYICIRKDYHTKEIKTFYTSMGLFEM